MQEIQGYMQGVASLDIPISDDNSLTLADTPQADFSLENDTVDEIMPNTLKMNYGKYEETVRALLSDGKLRETQTADYFSNFYPIDCAVLSVNALSCQKCGAPLSLWIFPEI